MPHFTNLQKLHIKEKTKLEKTNLNFNILKNYLAKLRDLEANLKDSDKYNKKWTVIML